MFKNVGVKTASSPTFWPPATEDNSVDGDTLLTFPLGVDDGTLSRRGTETGVGVGTSCRASCLQKGGGRTHTIKSGGSYKLFKLWTADESIQNIQTQWGAADGDKLKESPK